jgi:prophage antirepressor-like protein
MANQSNSATAPISFSFTAHEVRIVSDDKNEPWFCAKDVCDVLGYVNDSDAIKKHCREAGVAKRDLSSGGQMRELTFINEGNLYRLIVKSRKPEAEKFEIWLMEEVLPAIRKTGRYIAPAAEPTGPVERYIDLTTHPEFRHLIGQFQLRFWFGNSASHAAWANLRKIGGARATAFPESQLPRAMTELHRMVERSETFFKIKCNFEESGIKWVFGSDAAMLPEPGLPPLGEQLRLAA